jgi:Zn-dependent protease with chaperone function
MGALLVVLTVVAAVGLALVSLAWSSPTSAMAWTPALTGGVPASGPQKVPTQEPSMVAAQLMPANMANSRIVAVMATPAVAASSSPELSSTWLSSRLPTQGCPVWSAPPIGNPPAPST